MPVPVILLNKVININMFLTKMHRFTLEGLY